MDEENLRLKESLIAIASEQFRFDHVFERMIEKLDPIDQKKYSSQYAWFTKKVSKALESVNLRIINFCGKIYDPGMPVTPVNLDEFSTDDVLYVAEMIEPVIMDNDTLIKSGTVVLGRKEA